MVLKDTDTTKIPLLRGIRRQLRDIKEDRGFHSYNELLRFFFALLEKYPKEIKGVGPQKTMTKKEILDRAQQSYEKSLTQKEMAEYCIEQAKRINKLYKAYVFLQ